MKLHHYMGVAWRRGMGGFIVLGRGAKGTRYFNFYDAGLYNKGR